jgi:hypothetical protein
MDWATGFPMIGPVRSRARAPVVKGPFGDRNGSW